MAKDLFHDAVKRALEKDGWEITDDPLEIKYKKVKLYIDLGAEKFLEAQKGNKKIAVEIKSFLGHSVINEFNSALGQYLGYLKIIRRIEPERALYLAIPNEVEKLIKDNDYFQELISDYGLKIIVYDPQQESILSWIN
ncbi:MAG: XisH family protein [Leptospiraceae bacterium]|nr:XisH family protein [Leptospiraceae bacterium]